MKINSTALLFVVCLTATLVSSPLVLAYESKTVTDGGTVKGKIVFQGQSAPMRTVVPTKNKDVCGGERQEPLVEVGMNNGVKNAVIIIKDIANGKTWEKSKVPLKINNEKCIFHPHVQIVPVGSDFVIKNSDPFLHNTHSFYGDKTAFNVALPFQGAQVERTLDKSGVIHVKCDVHSWMEGWIFVADNPYYALSDEDGTFTINEIPPGDYTLLIWQEHDNRIEKQVTVKAGDTTDIGSIEIQ